MATYLCTCCTNSFSIAVEDTHHLEMLAPTIGGQRHTLPHPTLCPACRQERRLAFRNERHLYKRECAFSKKNIISIYAPESPLIIYSPDIWWSDKWDPLYYGQEIDWSRPFFEQFQELLHKVPLPGNMVFNSENCDYNAFVANSHNCYMCAELDESDTVLYTKLSINCKDSLDCCGIFDCSRCFSCMDCSNCHNCRWTTQCQDSDNLYFCCECTGCHNCIGCTGLHNKDYYIFNEPVTKEAFEAFLQEHPFSQASMVAEVQQKAEALAKTLPHPYRVALKTTESTGNFLNTTEDAYQSFEIDHSRRLRYAGSIQSSEDMNDVNHISTCSRFHETIACFQSSNVYFSHTIIGDCHDIFYSFLCTYGCSDLFGSIGLRHKQYCILNKQYTKEAYQDLVPRLITHMQRTGEWGDFFPATMSPFGYNESAAMDYFPKTDEQIRRRGWRWKHIDTRPAAQATAILPEDSRNVSEDVCQEILECGTCGSNYKIVPHELALILRLGLLLPYDCPRCRYKARMDGRLPRTLYARHCAHCRKDLESPYAPDRPEILFCDACYNAETR